MLKCLLIGFISIAVWLNSGCENMAVPKSSDEQKPKVVATTTHLADLVRQIAGKHVEVIPLMKAGVDPHSYRATAKDIAHLQSADLIIFHGLSLEGKMARVLEDTQSGQKAPYSPCIDLPQDLLLRESKHTIDPHVWFSPDLWTLCGRSFTDKLIDFYPDKSSLFEANFQKFKKSVKRIDEWGQSMVGSIPVSSRVLITSHDAFQYFGNHFHIEVVALQGINTSTEAGLADRTNLVDFIRKHNSPALFIESSVNPKALKEIARESGSVIGGTLFSDALGAPTQFAKGPDNEHLSTATWQGMMAHNIRTIAQALQKTP